MQHIIFDLDGTLVDSLDDIAEAISLAYDRCGHRLNHSRDEIRKQLGGQTYAILQGLTPNLPAEKLEEVRRAFRQLYDHGAMAFTRVYPGVPELLDDLVRAGKSLYVVTNKPELPTLRTLERCGLRGFQRILCADSFGKEKPVSKSELLQLLLQHDFLSAESCVYVGDTPEDALASRQAGIAMLAVLYGYGDAVRLREISVHQVSDIAELKRWLLAC